MTDAPRPYHSLTRAERDHLVAAANLDGVDGKSIQRRVEELRGGERPGNTTTYTTLDGLVGMGLIEKQRVNGNTNAYYVTDLGGELLDAAAAQFG